MKALAIALICFLYGKSTIAQHFSNSKVSLKQEHHAISETVETAITREAACKKAFVDLPKNIEALEINKTLQRNVPLVEMWRDDLILKGYVFPRPLDLNNREAIHSALNKGAVIVNLKSSITPEIAKKIRDAIVSSSVLRFLNFLFSFSDFGTSNPRTRLLVKTGKISEEEIRQFYKELHQVTRELETGISAADGQDIRFAKFIGQATDNRPITAPSGHRHTLSDGRTWVNVVYTVFGPAGTLFKTRDGQPAITLPGQALLLPEKKRNKIVLGEAEPLPLHATPRLPGERLVLVFSFQKIL